MIKREALIAKIQHAFKDVKLGNGVGLYEAQAIDYYASLEERQRVRAKDELESWQNIKIADVYKCSDSPSFFDAEGMRFHLPVFLLQALEFFEKEEEELYDRGELIGAGPNIEFHLTSALKYHGDKTEMGARMRAFDKERYALLNEEQIDCIIAFLHWSADGWKKDNPHFIELNKAIEHWQRKRSWAEEATMKIQMFPGLMSACDFELKGNRLIIIVSREETLKVKGGAYSGELETLEIKNELFSKLFTFRNSPTPKQVITIADGILFKIKYKDSQLNFDLELSSIQKDSVEEHFVFELFQMSIATTKNKDLTNYLNEVKKGFFD